MVARNRFVTSMVVAGAILPLLRSSALPCSTPTPTQSAVSATPGRTPIPAATPTSTGGQTLVPPPLINPQNPVNYGADPRGILNSAAAFQNAIAVGDLDVPVG